MNLSYFYLDVDLSKVTIKDGNLIIPAKTADNLNAQIIYKISAFNNIDPSKHQGWNFGEYGVTRHTDKAGRQVFVLRRLGMDVGAFRIEQVDPPPSQTKDWLPTESLSTFLTINEDLFLAYEELVVDYNTTKAVDSPFYRYDYNSIYSNEIISANVRTNLLKALDERSRLWEENIIVGSGNQWVKSYDDVAILLSEDDLAGVAIDVSASMWRTSIYFEFEKDAIFQDNILKLVVDFDPFLKNGDMVRKTFKFESGQTWRDDRQEMLDYWRAIADIGIVKFDEYLQGLRDRYSFLIDKYITNEYRKPSE